MTDCCSGCPIYLHCLIDLLRGAHFPSLPIYTFRFPFVPDSYNQCTHARSGHYGLRPKLTASMHQQRHAIQRIIQDTVDVRDWSGVLPLRPVRKSVLAQICVFRKLYSKKGQVLTWDTGNPWLADHKFAVDSWAPLLVTDDKYIQRLVLAAEHEEDNTAGYTMLCIVDINTEKGTGKKVVTAKESPTEAVDNG